MPSHPPTRDDPTLKSFGRLLDEYLSEYPDYETIVITHDRDANPILVVTQVSQNYDYTDTFSEVIDLREEIADKRREVEKVQAKIRSLKRDQKSLENAIKKIARFQS